VWLYFRFNLSTRDVEDLLAERGISVSYETIRAWCQKFGPKYARRLRRRHPGYGDTIYVDEVFVRIGGVRRYLWRAIDQDGEIVDVYTSPKNVRRPQRNASSDGSSRPPSKRLAASFPTSSPATTSRTATWSPIRFVRPRDMPTIGSNAPIKRRVRENGRCDVSSQPTAPNAFSPYTPPPRAFSIWDAITFAQTIIESFAVVPLRLGNGPRPYDPARSRHPLRPRSSRPRDLPPRPLTEPGVNLSIHRALVAPTTKSPRPLQ